MLSTLRRKLTRAARLSGRERKYLAVAILGLARARMELSRRPARQILDELQKRHAPDHAHDGFDVNTMTWAIAAAANAVPWRADCLIQSIVASRWLRRHGILADFRLGVHPGTDNTLAAHAWVELNGVVLTGGTGVERYHLLIAP